MNAAIDLATRFPLVVFTVLLALLAVYWLLVALRLAPVELFEHDSLKDDHLASALVSLGFAGVPASLALTLLVVLAGALTLALELAVLRWLPLGFFRIPLGVGVIWGPSRWPRRRHHGSACGCSIGCTIARPMRRSACRAACSASGCASRRRARATSLSSRRCWRTTRPMRCSSRPSPATRHTRGSIGSW